MRIARALALLCAVAAADALVVTRAMKATTIAEIFVEPGRVRVDLEIGADDLKAFGRLLPDELRTRIGLDNKVPLADRLEAFFREDFVIAADTTLRFPIVREIELRPRVRRDEITGAPMGESGEIVLFVRLEYAMKEDPGTLTLRPPTDPPASIGFVAYHDGVAVSDFRYLPGQAVLELNWGDAWFSRFRNRNLWRRYDSPLQVFLYVDHFEARVEVVCRPRDLVEVEDVIHPEHRQALKDEVAALLARAAEVTIDGERRKGELDRIHFVRRTLRSTGVVGPSEDMLSVSAMLGAIFVFPVDRLPRDVEVRWKLFPAGINRIPAVATDEAGGMPSILTRDDPSLRWMNLLKKAKRPVLAEVAPVRGRNWLLAGIGLGALALGLLLRRGLAVLAGVSVAALLWLWSSPGAPDPDEAREVSTALLGNIYRAFDYRSESAIYDVLARSVSGTLLERTYLETRRGLELANQGGARAKVRGIEVIDCEAEGLDGEPGFAARCTWIVDGAVGHWGHIHTRRNRYEARLIIRPVHGEWKLSELELASEERLTASGS